MNALRPWRVWFVPCSFVLTTISLVLTVADAAPGLEMTIFLLALPFSIGLVLRMMVGNPLIALVTRHRAVQIRIATLVGLPLTVALTVPVQAGRGLSPIEALAVAGVEAVAACLVGFELHGTAWRSQVRQSLLLAVLLGIEVLATESPAVGPGAGLLIGLAALVVAAVWWWRCMAPGEGAAWSVRPASSWWEPSRSTPSLPVHRWLAVAVAFSAGLVIPIILARWPVDMHGDGGASSSPMLMLIALGIPCWMAWNRCVPWRRRHLLAEVLAVSAAWPIPRRSWGWAIQARLVSRALPDSAAAAAGVISGALLADPGGAGVLMAWFALAGWIPVTMVAVFLAIALMSQDWLVWFGGSQLLVVGGSALLQYVPVERPGHAVAMLAVICLPVLAAVAMWLARRIARREW